MKIPILIEPTPNQRFRATRVEPLLSDIEADTPEAVLEKMKELIGRRLSQGARIAVLNLPDPANPWLEGVAIFRDDPLFEDWQRAIGEYRRKANQGADAL